MAAVLARPLETGSLPVSAGGELVVMSQADAEDFRLSPERPLGSFHLFRDLR